MIIMKFGGSSIGSAMRIRQSADIIKQRLDKQPIVVVSAVGGVTDMIIDNANSAVKGEYDIEAIREKHTQILNDLELAEDLVNEELNEIEIIYKGLSIIKELTPKTFDIIQSFGERMSCKIVAGHLNKIGINAKPQRAYDIGMVTDNNFGCAEPLKEAYDLIKENLSEAQEVNVITGFIGKNKNNEITTLGRGGSDYTAAILGAAVGSEEIQIWTDVDGIMTCDPRVVEQAKSIKEVSFNEAAELAYFGAKVLHPKTIIPAVRNNIPVRVLNTYNPKHPGTLIVNKVSSKGVKAIAFKKNTNLISIRSTRMLMAYGFLAKIFRVFEEHKIAVDMVTTTEVSVSLTVDDNKNLDKAIDELRKFSQIKIENDKSIVSIVGEVNGGANEILGKVFSKVCENGITIKMISQGASEINLSFIVNSEDIDKTVKLLHEHFFGGRE
jgi:aspartate kinase